MGSPSPIPPLSPSGLSVGSFEWGYVPEAGQPSSADLIASQSQDFVDERLAEFQATIAQLQSKRRVTFLDVFARFGEGQKRAREAELKLECDRKKPESADW